MASNNETIIFILDQLNGIGTLSAKKMFGEYAIYCNNKIVALVCDDMLYVKPTIAGKTFIGDVDEQPPYPGAKNYYLISGDLWEDKEWLSDLMRITHEALPSPKPKKNKK